MQTPQSKQPYIMIVEDDPEFYEDLFAALTSEGYEVSPYTKNYQEAVVRFNQKTPDIVLMDIQLDGVLNGMNVAQYIRTLSDVPIIFLSRLYDKELLQQSYEIKSNFYLYKDGLKDLRQVLISVSQIWQELQDNSKAMIGISVMKSFVKSEAKEVGEMILHYRNIRFITTYIGFKKTENLSQEGKGYVSFYNTGEEQFFAKFKIDDLEESLPDYFARVNRSDIINVYKITRKMGNHVLYIQDHKFELTDKYRDKVLQKIAKYFRI